MPHYSKYACSECGDEYPDRTQLVRKRVDFVILGPKGRTVASRTVAWLCRKKCMIVDPDYNRKAFDAPGMKSAPLERVRLAKENGNATQG